MYRAVVIGTSLGGMEALKNILPRFPKDFPMPILVVLHIGEHSNHAFIELLNSISLLEVKEAEDKETILPGTVYFAPPNYHLLVNDDECCSLSTEGKINHSRPAIDVLFETAAWHYKDQLIGVILCGLSSDGAKGLLEVKESGGYTMVETPDFSTAPIMPREAFKLAKPNICLKQNEIANKIIYLSKTGRDR